MVKLNLLQQINNNEESAKDTLNSNFAKIEEALNNSVSTKDLTTMQADLDMGTHALYNLKTTEEPTSMVTRGYLQNLVDSTQEAIDTANRVYSNSIAGAKTFVNDNVAPPLLEARDQAVSSASTAVRAASNSLTSELNAKTSELNAKNSETIALSSSASATENAEEAAIWNQGSPSEVSSLGGVLSCKDYATQLSGTIPQATELVAGKARIATAQEVTEGTNDSTIVTPKKLSDAIISLPTEVSTNSVIDNYNGIVKTQAELNSEFRRQTRTVEFYQNAGSNLEEVSSGVYKIPTDSLFTLANGLSFTRVDEPQIDITAWPDGKYRVYTPVSGSLVAIEESLFTISAEEPISPSTDLVWFNPYQTPYTSSKWNGLVWEDFPYSMTNSLLTVDSSATPIVAFPLMTGENLPAGQYSSASSTLMSLTSSWKAFDGDEGEYWMSDEIPGPHRLTRWADTAVTANAVYLSATGGTGQPDVRDNFSFESFTLRGSNDGIVWTDIQTYTDLPSQYRGSGGLTLLFPKSTYKYFDIYNAFARGGAGQLGMWEVSYRLVQPYNTTDIGNRTAYTEAKDITPVSGVYFDVLSSINGGGWTATSDGVLYATNGFGNTAENRIFVDGIEFTQLTSYGGDSNGNVNSCTTIIVHKGQTITLGTRALVRAIFIPARKGTL